MDSHAWTLLAIMIAAGAFGGVASYYGLSGKPFRAPKPGTPDQPLGSQEKNEQSLPVTEPADTSPFSPILRGIAAAFIVPLFLSSVSSNLLQEQIGFIGYLSSQGLSCKRE